ncbi:putative serine protease PepD [Branchiibius hedensis]|uniref:Putative serine protease PepD n=1 Tax=Branchiibius hedensis TaxID=672460 RepID=A0A2Y8ZZF2_9MICO|nr:trypsin-like peptidase domain-containing protein [Branchiibius hedensis]PWJ26475.1 putative serine protease PepD [Branchiibius hedensis]SSA35287.1 putative serine protease PepD [Branchiibius hedensis]
MSNDQYRPEGEGHDAGAAPVDSTQPIYGQGEHTQSVPVDQNAPAAPTGYQQPQGSYAPHQQGAFTPPGGYPAYGTGQYPSVAGQYPAQGAEYPAQGQQYGFDATNQPNTTTPATTNRSSRKAPWIAVPLAALVAAALASGSTYALSHGSNSSASGSSAGGVTSTNVTVTDGGQEVQSWVTTAAKVSPSVVSITVTNGQSGGEGSGVILDKEGHIVTNNHVVTLDSSSSDGDSITVTLNNNTTYKATIVGTDPSTDLAVIKLTDPPSDLQPIAIGDVSKVVVGQPVMAIGNPLGLSGTVTSGIVSALNRPVTTSGADSQNQYGQQTASDAVYTNAIQTSAAINPGNSGGALVNEAGELIGINSSIATLGGSSESSQSGSIGIGFAIPATVVSNVTEQLISNGKAVHAQLGISAQNGSVTTGGATVAGAKVGQVVSGSAAADAGLKQGDVITAFNGAAVTSSDALVGFVRAQKVGDKVTLTVYRDGQKMDVTATLKEASS